MRCQDFLEKHWIFAGIPVFVSSHPRITKVFLWWESLENSRLVWSVQPVVVYERAMIN